jgi:hypothetical protein
VRQSARWRDANGVGEKYLRLDEVLAERIRVTLGCIVPVVNFPIVAHGGLNFGVVRTARGRHRHGPGVSRGLNGLGIVGTREKACAPCARGVGGFGRVGQAESAAGSTVQLGQGPISPFEGFPINQLLFQISKFEITTANLPDVQKFPNLAS